MLDVVYRDSGYGMIKAHEKEKCTAVPVESGNSIIFYPTWVI